MTSNSACLFKLFFPSPSDFRINVNSSKQGQIRVSFPLGAVFNKIDKRCGHLAYKAIFTKINSSSSKKKKNKNKKNKNKKEQEQEQERTRTRTKRIRRTTTTITPPPPSLVTNNKTTTRTTITTTTAAATINNKNDLRLEMCCWTFSLHFH